MAGDSAGLRLLAAEAEALGTTVDALALAWVMSHEWVDVCLSGAATVEQAACHEAPLLLLLLLRPPPPRFPRPLQRLTSLSHPT